MEGIEFLEELNRINYRKLNQIKVHVLTSSLDEHDKDRAKSYTIIKDFQSKPISLEMIHKIVQY